jgi:hypothetical protein
MAQREELTMPLTDKEFEAVREWITEHGKLLSHMQNAVNSGSLERVKTVEQVMDNVAEKARKLLVGE